MMPPLTPQTGSDAVPGAGMIQPSFSMGGASFPGGVAGPDGEESLIPPIAKPPHGSERSKTASTPPLIVVVFTSFI